MLVPVIAAAKAGDAAGAARLVPIGVNHQLDFWDTATPDIGSMLADNARTIPLVFITAPPPPPMRSPPSAPRFIPTDEQPGTQRQPRPATFHNLCAAVPAVPAASASQTS
jgi:hypothetical protein